LAAVTDFQLDPDRRAWHLAQAVPDKDEEVAAELERSAGRAQARGGMAAAAAFLERAALLTGDPARRAGRALAAAQAMVHAGAAGAARDLLAMAEAGLLSDLEQARLELVRARLVSATSRGGDAPLLLLRAAQRLEGIDISLARATYLDAVAAAIYAGRLASPGASTIEVARAAAAAPLPPHRPRPPDLLLDGLTTLFTRGYTAALPLLRQAVAAAEESTSADEEPHWLWLACVMASHVWDDERWELLSRRYIQLVRQLGALSELPLALDRRIRPLLFAGKLTTAAALISSIMRDVTQRGEGYGIACAEWANAVLSNGLGLPRDAVVAAERAAEYHGDLGFYRWALVELVEAAVHSGKTETAADAYRRLTET